jgi:hypothetical protein
MGATIIGFLAAIASKVVIALLSAAAGWFAKMIHQQVQDKKSDTDAKESLDPLKKAQTGDEIDKASDGALGGF